jgi:putative FmdB family regulatory protein
MPIYTYRCENCGVQFERQQSFNEQPLVRCPECSKKTLRKVYTPVGIVFKGSGFYATDHRSPSGAGRVPSTTKSNESESEAKPAKASESSNAPAPASTDAAPQKD